MKGWMIWTSGLCNGLWLGLLIGYLWPALVMPAALAVIALASIVIGYRVVLAATRGGK